MKIKERARLRIVLQEVDEKGKILQTKTKSVYEEMSFDSFVNKILSIIPKL